MGLYAKKMAATLAKSTRFKIKEKRFLKPKWACKWQFRWINQLLARHIFERDVLFVKVPEKDAQALQKAHADDLTAEEQEVLKEYIN